MAKLQSFFNVIDHYKYLITIVVGVAVLSSFGENSMVQLMQLSMKKADLEAEIKRYRQQSEESSRELRALKNNKDMIEKVARERYFMKMDEEDVFVLSTDME